MKISTLKTFMNEAAKKYGIKDANIKLNKHGMVIEMASNNKIQFAHQFAEAVKSKLVVEGFAFKEVKNDSDFDKIVKNYLFRNANITTNRDNEQIIIPTDEYGYGYDNGEEYFDTDYQNSIDNMTDDEYRDFVLFSDVNTPEYKGIEFIPDEGNSDITFCATCCEIPDECYGNECYSGNLFDRISTDNDTDIDYSMNVDDMIDKDYEENDDYETDLSKAERSAKRIVDFGTDETDLDEEEIDEKRKDILLGKMEESFKYMPTTDKKVMKEETNRYNLNNGTMYGNPYVEVEDDGTETLYSYKTKIMSKKPDGKTVRYWDNWSTTTGRHIKKFSGLSADEYFDLELVNESTKRKNKDTKKKTIKEEVNEIDYSDYFFERPEDVDVEDGFSKNDSAYGVRIYSALNVDFKEFMVNAFEEDDALEKIIDYLSKNYKYRNGYIFDEDEVTEWCLSNETEEQLNSFTGINECIEDNFYYNSDYTFFVPKDGLVCGKLNDRDVDEVLESKGMNESKKRFGKKLSESKRRLTKKVIKERIESRFGKKLRNRRFSK